MKKEHLRIIKPKRKDKVKSKNPKKSKNRPPYKKADYKEFIKFYSMPSVFRQEKYGFRTKDGFAKHFELSPDTLTDWQKRPEFNRDVDEQLKKWGADKTPDVIASLYRTILADGKAAEVKLWLQFMKNWKEGMILEQPSIEKNNKLDKLLENAKPEVKQQLNELLKKILPDRRKGE